MNQKKRILVFSDFDSIRNIIVKSLTNKGYSVVAVKTYKEALHELNGTSFGLAITDYDIENKGGIKLIEYMRSLTSYIFTPILLLHSGKKEQLSEQLKDFNIAYFMNKPFEMQNFYSVVERLA